MAAPAPIISQPEFKTIVLSLHSVSIALPDANGRTFQTHVQEVLERLDPIMKDATLFMKAYYLDLLEKHEAERRDLENSDNWLDKFHHALVNNIPYRCDLFPLNEHFFRNVLRVMNRYDTRGRPPSQADAAEQGLLLTFYDREFRDGIHDQRYVGGLKPSAVNLSNILNNAGTTFVTSILTNIKQHWDKHIKQVLRIAFHNHLANSQAINGYSSKELLRRLYAAFIWTGPYVGGVHTEPWNPALVPVMPVGSAPADVPLFCLPLLWDLTVYLRPPTANFTDRTLEAYLEASPSHFHHGLFRAQKIVECTGEAMHAATSISTDCIVNYFTFETADMVTLFREHIAHPLAGWTTTDIIHHINAHKPWAWGGLFDLAKINKGHTNYTFDYAWSTNGISANFRLIRNGLVARGRLPVVQTQALPVHNQPIEHLEALSPARLTALQIAGYEMVGCDPGMRDMLHMAVPADVLHGGIGGGHNLKSHSRLTREQLNVESKEKKYEDIRNRASKVPHAHPTRGLPHQITIKGLLESLSNHNSKSVHKRRFLLYCKAKIRAMRALSHPNFYGNLMYRKLRRNGKINRQRCFQRYAAKFSREHGDCHTTAIAIGAWGKSGHDRHHVGLRANPGCAPIRALVRAGYKVFWVNENNTSQVCYNCKDPALQARAQKFRRRWEPNPKNFGKPMRLVHGLLKCTTCNT
jgi:hypothetical protein